MHLKYIKLLILKIRFILGLCNFKFSFKILPPPSTKNKKQNKTRKLLPHNNTTSPTKKILTLPANTFLKFFTPPPPPPPPPPPHTHKLDGGACHNCTLFRGDSSSIFPIYTNIYPF